MPASASSFLNLRLFVARDLLHVEAIERLAVVLALGKAPFATSPACAPSRISISNILCSSKQGTPFFVVVFLVEVGYAGGPEAAALIGRYCGVAFG